VLTTEALRKATAKIEKVLELCRTYDAAEYGRSVPIGALRAAIYLDDRPITEDDERRGREIAQELGLEAS
jgi:hypothetical protein